MKSARNEYGFFFEVSLQEKHYINDNPEAESKIATLLRAAPCLSTQLSQRRESHTNTDRETKDMESRRRYSVQYKLKTLIVWPALAQGD